MQKNAKPAIQPYLFSFETLPMLPAPARKIVTVASLIISLLIYHKPAQAVEFYDQLSWASDSIGYYESFSHNNPVVRGAANFGGLAATGLEVIDDIQNSVKRANAGASRGKLLAGTVAKYSTKLVMQAGIGAAAVLAAPVCVATSGAVCTAVAVSLNEGADRLSDAYREGAESLFPDGEVPLEEDVSQSKSRWKIVAGVMRQNGEETPMDDLPHECSEMGGATDAYQIVAAARSPAVHRGMSCFGWRTLNDTKDYVAISQSCVVDPWGMTEVINTTRAIDDSTINYATIYIINGGQKIEMFTVSERCE